MTHARGAEKPWRTSRPKAARRQVCVSYQSFNQLPNAKKRGRNLSANARRFSFSANLRYSKPALWNPFQPVELQARIHWHGHGADAIAPHGRRGRVVPRSGAELRS